MKMDKKNIIKFIIWGTFSLWVGLVSYWVGFHNVDIAINLFRLEPLIDYSIHETNAIGWKFSLEDTYRIGIVSLEVSIFMLFIAGWLLGTGVEKLKNIK